MAVFVPVADGAQGELVFLWGSVVVSNRLWFIFDNPPFGVLDLQGLSDGLAAWASAQLLPHLSSDLVLALVRATDWSGAAPGAVAVTLSGTMGGVASPSYSANVALRVNLRWPLRFRERLNANFVPGIPDSAVVLNTPTVAFQNAIWNAYVNLIDATRLFTPVLNWRWVVASQYDLGSVRSSQLVADCIGPQRPFQLRLGQRRTRLP